MKQLIPVVMLASLTLVGCNNKKSSPPPAAPTPVELTPPPAPAPAPAPETYTPAPQPAPAPAVDKTTTKAVPAKTTDVKPAPMKTASASSAKTYLIRKGDTLSEIAAAHKTTVKKIMALNPEIKDADAIYVGQKLKMP